VIHPPERRVTIPPLAPSIDIRSAIVKNWGLSTREIEMSQHMPQELESSGAASSGGKRIVVVLPCLNEASTVGNTVSQFKAALPDAATFVIDNGSTDATADVARAAGAEVLVETLRGKGNAVRRAFSAIDADIYVLADGDGTYDAFATPRLVELLLSERLDMVVAARRGTSADAFPPGHKWGNLLFNRLLRALFGSRFDDCFSGYRVLSRRYVKSFPIQSGGFEIETEMTVHAALLRMPMREVACTYSARAPGSRSKLSTYRDGFRILWMIVNLLRLHRPMLFFTVTSGVFLLAALALFVPVFTEYMRTGLVPRFPTLIASIGLGVCSLLLMTAGFILDAIAHMQIEVRRLIYLNAEHLSHDR